MVLFSLQCYISKNPCSYKRFLWHNADFESMKRELCDFANNFITDYSIETPTEQLWCVFHDKLLLVLDSCVPSKTSTNNTKHPWINRKIIQLSRRKQRKYNLAKKTQSPSAWKEYKELRKKFKENVEKPETNSQIKQWSESRWAKEILYKGLV